MVIHIIYMMQYQIMPQVLIIHDFGMWYHMFEFCVMTLYLCFHGCFQIRHRNVVVVSLQRDNEHGIKCVVLEDDH